MEQREEKSFTAADGVRIRYWVAGAGPPVILLHGFTMSSAMWWENHVAEALSGRYRLIAPDLRSHGDSDRPHDPNSYGRALVSDIAQLISIEAPPGAHLVGFSLGAELLLPLAADHPAALRSIYLIGSGWSPAEIVEEYKAALDWVRANADRQSGKDFAALAALIEAVPATVGLSAAQIAAIDVPMAGLVGELDEERPYLERLAEARPDFGLEILPGVDHIASWRDPRLPEKIAGFLDAQPK